MTPPKHYLCGRADGPFPIDGRLDKDAWRRAPWTDDFEDIEGGARPRPRYRTRAKMLWDDAYFYIGAALEEPHVWATLTEHDSVIFQDNDFEIFIDPDGDNHDYYEIEINALNTVWDLRLVTPYRDGGPALNAWEIPGLRSAIHVDGTLNDSRDTDGGWSVEMAIPWAALGEFARRPAPPADGDQWRVNFSRVEWDITLEAGQYRKVPDTPEHNWVWSPQGVVDMHRPERWGYVQFTRAAPGEGTFRPDPSAPARELLMHLYQAQRDHQRMHGRWTDTVTELALPAWSGPTPTVALSDEGFVATVEFHDAAGETRRVHLRQDSRLWVD